MSLSAGRHLIGASLGFSHRDSRHVVQTLAGPAGEHLSGFEILRDTLDHARRADKRPPDTFAFLESNGKLGILVRRFAWLDGSNLECHLPSGHRLPLDCIR